MVYFGLCFIDLDVVGLVAHYDLGPEVMMIAKTGGRFALAFALNRALGFVRLPLVVVACGWWAEPINATLEPIAARFKKYLPWARRGENSDTTKAQ
mmetsp:Transcript_44524/g.96548  ORF Transcript_44524/g.96548 Transcript_44524/m.96548 type:complete len:96 (+) Transcript_44524:93-380(+)